MDAIVVVKQGVHSLESFPMKHIVFDCDGTLIDTSERRFRLFPGIKELLVELSREHQLYVWTARDRLSTLRILEDCEVKGLFEAFATISDAPPKPATGGLFNLLSSTVKESICVIGDSSNDMLGAKSFGVLAIGAIWNIDANAQFLRHSGADFIVSHPSECSKLIQQFLKN
jgi:phosphoglycolate phosphatase